MPKSRTRKPLGLATPISIMVASGRGAQLGVLFRDAQAIENLRSVDTLVLDKTGTITVGRPAFDRAIAVGGFDERQLLSWAAGLDRNSEHPLARAVVAGAEARGVQPAAVGDFESVTGQGVRGESAGRSLALGNVTLMKAQGVDVGTFAAGAIAVGDPMKETTPGALQALRADGLRLVMLTGDSEATAHAVAADLPIDEVIAEVQPKTKRQSSRGCNRRVGAWRWLATASTTRPRWPGQMSASRWALARTLRWRARRSRS
jgi:P-type Cu+ transporter